jgi:hypothetical protein
VSIHAAACFRRLGIFIRDLRFAVARLEKLFEELKAARQWYREDILQERAAPFHLRLERVFFRSFGGNYCSDILHEINSTFFALHAGALLISAGRAVKTHRHVAALAEARYFTHRCATFRAGNCGLQNRRRCGIPRDRGIRSILPNYVRVCRGLSTGAGSWQLHCCGGRVRLRRFRLKRRAGRYIGRSIGWFTAVPPRG